MCSGLHLDRAWPALGPTGGGARRELSVRLVVELVRAARDTGVDALAILGGLCDPRTVMPSTLTQAATALGSFDGEAWIVPGGLDADAHDSPYDHVDWADNTRVLRSTSEPFTFMGHRVMAWSPSGRGMADVTEPTILLSSGGEEFDPVGLPGLEPPGLLLYGAPASALQGQTVAVGPLVPPAGHPAGAARLVAVEQGEVRHVDDVEPSGRAVPSATIDVGALGEDADLADEVTRARQGMGGTGIVRLTGRLPRGVLLPGSVDPSWDAAGVDDADVVFEVPEDRSEAGGSTTVEQFVASVATTDATARTRHQAIALGLQALSGSDE